MKSISRFALIFTIATAALVPLLALSSSSSMAAEVVRVERQVGSFQQLEVADAVNVYLTQGPVKPAVIEAEANLVPLVELEISGSVLKVHLKRNSSFSSRHDINVYLSTPDVNALSIYGSGDLKVVGKLSSKDSIKMAISGSGSLSGELNTPTVAASIAGAGDIKVKGKTRDLKVSIAGSGDYDGFGLLAENTSVSIVGSGDAHVYASKNLEVSTAGSGDVSYSGDPQVRSSIMGSGSVKKR
ncbi:Putative auto-transporter adhesin, head GIN domain [Collimonas sp. OK607]|uniref:head GIN domain-containing protein n=1 Tax=Collimonas sp. OK607 TaxID=1798194 RepID=UPI0008F0030C|nr:head GIN domain-containing protein [Collimonas sp. OK607]SFB37594.1 Putative auto-transporter adhesin, head GIN domain [Collimonas sp. OK607]